MQDDVPHVLAVPNLISCCPILYTKLALHVSAVLPTCYSQHVMSDTASNKSSHSWHRSDKLAAIQSALTKSLANV